MEVYYTTKTSSNLPKSKPSPLLISKTLTPSKLKIPLEIPTNCISVSNTVLGSNGPILISLLRIKTPSPLLHQPSMNYIKRSTAAYCRL